MNDGQPLTGKVALVTGAGSGLGAATATMLGRAGAPVACLDRNGEAAESTAERLRAEGCRALASRCDVRDLRQICAAVEKTMGSYGRIDVTINCAGVDFVVSADEMSIEQWETVIGVNLTGPFLVAKAVWPIMREQGGGHIVNIASTAAVRAWGNASAYHASKWGVRGMSRALGVEGRDAGIIVTCVIPGGMRTHWFDSFPDQGIPMPDETNLQDPANVARTILCAVTMPPETALQEIIVTPVRETSWP